MSDSSADFRTGIIECLPHLRAFARALTGSRERADDLVQDTIVRALAARHRFEPGTNLRAWLLTILRNQRISQLRRQRIESTCLHDLFHAQHHSPAAQHARAECNEVAEALNLMPERQREALILVAGAGLSYEEAAGICGCAVGTVKSRVNRARGELQRLLAQPRPRSRSDAVRRPSDGALAPMQRIFELHGRYLPSPAAATRAIAATMLS